MKLNKGYYKASFTNSCLQHNHQSVGYDIICDLMLDNLVGFTENAAEMMYYFFEVNFQRKKIKKL